MFVLLYILYHGFIVLMRAKLTSLYYCAILLYDAAIFNSSSIEKKFAILLLASFVTTWQQMGKFGESFKNHGAFGAP